LAWELEPNLKRHKGRFKIEGLRERIQESGERKEEKELKISSRIGKEKNQLIGGKRLGKTYWSMRTPFSDVYYGSSAEEKSKAYLPRGRIR